MARLGSIIAGLPKISNFSMKSMSGSPVDRLNDIPDFGSNPGTLRARYFLPKNLQAHAPLVVVLHGCTQSATSYEIGAGWSQLAQEYGFALLMPEQMRSNNANLCFNWFSPGDIKRGSGEALSIRQMISFMVASHEIDEGRIFITGLSAGGAMASVMLANYPEVFAGGAIIAGLPFGCASSVSDALTRMRGEGYPSDAHIAGLISTASGHEGPWPTISVWHGDADTTVHHSNANRIIAQWQTVHGVSHQTPVKEVVDGAVRRVWQTASGQAVIEAYMVRGMGHGTPLSTRGADGCGVCGPYMLEAGISSTHHILRFWDIDRAETSIKSDVGTGLTRSVAYEEEAVLGRHPATSAPTASPDTVATIIEDALRKAGLMR